MIYAVDFDGTIVEDKYPEIGKPNERLISYLKHLKKKGHTLILWTCRVDKDLDEAVEFCNKHGIEFDYINENAKEHIEKFGGDTRKIFADYYIDDKSMDYRYFEYKRSERMKMKSTWIIQAVNAIDKLADLEDIEEELCVDLVTLFKALKSNKVFYVTDENKIEEYAGTIEIVDTTNIKLPFVAVRDLKDYGKTWALTKEELEEK